MKKRTQVMALVLCLVLSAFAFASCGKEKKPATTTASGACAHEWGDYVAEVAATCSSVGMKVRYCKICKAPDPETVEIPKLAHTESEDFKTLSDPTCSAPGYKTKFCTVCGANLDGTGEDIPADPKKHNVESWTVTSPVSLFNQTGKREGVCTLCKQPVKEDLTFQLDVMECLDSSKNGEKEYIPAQSGILSVQGDKHFYATDTDPANDLLMEFSILWNPTMLNLIGTVDGSQGPYCATRIMGGGVTNLTYWSGSDNPKGSDCSYAGGFEGAAVKNGCPEGMLSGGGIYSDYPNIGGAVAAADANDLENGHEWGWHRVGVRVHQEVRNLAALKADTTPGATAPKYKITVTVYFDGVEKFSCYGDLKPEKEKNRLFSVASNGDGTVTYTEIAENIMAIPFVLHSRRVKSDTAAYVVTADYSVTCGTEFVQNVQRVGAPTGNPTYEVAESVVVPAKVYYKLAD